MLAVNDAYRLAPWADHLYACDYAWWQHHYAAVCTDFAGKLWSQSCEADAAFERVQLVQGAHQPGLGEERIHFGSNSGYQAVNLAYLLGATDIYLLGYDMQVRAGRRHFFGDHPKAINKDSPYGQFVKAFETIRPADYGIRIINCTPGSALTCFEATTLDEALRDA